MGAISEAEHYLEDCDCLRGVVLLGTPAMAQDATGELAEIVVTAQKRDQLASDVGISMIAATGAELRSAGVTDISLLAQAVPGFTAATSHNGLPISGFRVSG
jgi:iron complex outermembrane recepter protein